MTQQLALSRRGFLATSVAAGGFAPGSRLPATAQEAATLEIPTEITLKDPSTWTIVGQPLKRLHTLGKLDGSQIYGVDVTLPGMVSRDTAITRHRRDRPQL